MPNAAAVTSRIPSMTVIETVTLWKNAIRILNDTSKSPLHAAARTIAKAVAADWLRRSRAPIPPDELFAWPETNANAGHGQLDTTAWVREGVLQFMGYKVGHQGETLFMRQAILSLVFSECIPPVFSRAYLEEWGDPSTVQRLKKLADTIASLARNAKRRRTQAMDQAVRDWEADLEFLYYEYYVGRFSFAWPDASIANSH